VPFGDLMGLRAPARSIDIWVVSWNVWGILYSRLCKILLIMFAWFEIRISGCG